MDLEIIHDNDLPKGKVIIQSHKHTEQLPDIIACMRQLSQNKLFPGKYQDDIYYIKHQDIISFRIENKVLTIITSDHQYTSTQRLYEVRSQMNKGRYTVLPSEPNTLFLIGLRVNKWYKIHKWLPVLLAMPPMLNELLKNKSLGCLSYEMFFKYRGMMVVQY